jgi:hypothetical protein
MLKQVLFYFQLGINLKFKKLGEKLEVSKRLAVNQLTCIGSECEPHLAYQFMINAQKLEKYRKELLMKKSKKAQYAVIQPPSDNEFLEELYAMIKSMKFRFLKEVKDNHTLIWVYWN